jgi:hypothetical protein
MKKFFLAFIVFCSLVFLYRYLTKPSPHEPFYLSPETEISEEKPQQVHEAMQYIQKINEKNAKIKNIFIENIKINLEQKNMLGIRVFGKLAMQKDNLFRLSVWHRISGLEMDIGSNQQYFWFWSKRMDNPALYYAKHEDLNRTMLKTPLNPTWLMESLNIGQINTKDIEIVKFKTFWAISQVRLSTIGEPVKAMCLIDPEKEVIIGHYLYDMNNKIIASAETKEFTQKDEFLLPKKLLIIWYDEGISMTWDLTSPQINSGIDQSYWSMPKMRNKIDMGK